MWDVSFRPCEEVYGNEKCLKVISLARWCSVSECVNMEIEDKDVKKQLWQSSFYTTLTEMRQNYFPSWDRQKLEFLFSRSNIFFTQLQNLPAATYPSIIYLEVKAVDTTLGCNPKYIKRVICGKLGCDLNIYASSVWRYSYISSRKDRGKDRDGEMPDGGAERERENEWFTAE